MEQIFEQMNENYCDKYYPKGSVYEKLNAEHKRGSVVLAVFLVLMGCFFGTVLIWVISRIVDDMRDGNTDLQILLIVLAVVGIPFLLCVLGLVYAVKNYRKGAEVRIKKSMELSGLSEAEAREFDRQAMQSDSYILKFKDGLAAKVAAEKDGILTRDYLWMGSTTGLIVKREDIIAACFYKWSYYAGKKKIWCQSVAVLTRQDKMSSAEATSERGQAFIELLVQANPSIYVEKKLLSEGKEYDNWRKELCGKAAQAQA